MATCCASCAMLVVGPSEAYVADFIRAGSHGSIQVQVGPTAPCGDPSIAAIIAPGRLPSSDLPASCRAKWIVTGLGQPLAQRALARTGVAAVISPRELAAEPPHRGQTAADIFHDRFQLLKRSSL